MSLRIFYLLGIMLLLVAGPGFAQQELRICALRVEFVEDENDLTTGNGLFVLNTDGVTEYTVDPPPHNRPYFQDQITAVRNYFLTASKGKLRVSGTVFPRTINQSYQLPNTMGHYNPNTTDEENNAMLAQLFIDAVNLADNDPDIVFSDYDVVTIFHAGVGKDIDLGYDETPQDLPSLYMTPKFFRDYLDPDFSGIPVDGGTSVIDRGLLLPETESQAGFEIGLTGLFAANIGSHLGWYDLFSPSDQLSGIGSFGIMDAGLFNGLGLAPALPSAFSRLLAGWEEPVVISAPAENIPVYRFGANFAQSPTLYKIPINTSEYYLVEFRGDRSVNLDSLYFELAEGRSEAPTYLEVMKTYLPDRIEVSDSTGVLLNIENPDWGLPGAGLLIWHIDESIIAEKGAENRINDDKENRAVDLEEADGSQDIGYEYSVVEPGFQSELGTWLDFWFDDNPSPLYQNKFTPSTSPNTRANRTLANSHVHITDISSTRNSFMTFSLNIDFFEPGYPVRFHDQNGTIPPTPPQVVLSDPLTGKIGSESLPAVLVSGSNGNIYSFLENGAGFPDPQSNLSAVFPRAEVINIVLADTSNDGVNDILVATGASGMICSYRFADENNDQLLDTLYTKSLKEQVSAKPVYVYPFIYVGTDQGNVYRIKFSGEVDSIYQFMGPVAAITVEESGQVVAGLKDPGAPAFPRAIIDIDSDGHYDVVEYQDLKNIIIAGKKISVPEEMKSAPSFADLDNDGYYEIVLVSETTIYIYNYNGVNLSNYPVQPVLQDGEALSGMAMILDANSDTRPDILVTTSQGQLFAFDLKGKLLDGYPFSSGGTISQSAVVNDIDDDGQAELFVVNDQGMMFAWQLDALWNSEQIWWTQAGYGDGNNHFVVKQLTAKGLPLTELLPGQRAYVYPNPNKEDYTTIRYYLSKPADVGIKIFDLAGDLVDSFTAPGTGQTDNEVRWPLDNVSSGVYLCRIEAVSATERSSKIIKIMVIK